MKSEKYLNHIFKPMSQIQNKVKAYDRDMVNKAIELAEQEAEERMRAKAIEAFKSSCKYQDGCLGTDRKCDQTQCADLNEFIQKLN